MDGNMSAVLEDTAGHNIRSGREQEYVTMRVGEQLFGISVLVIQDVLHHQSVTHVPLSPPIVDGLLNLRGRVVTAVNLRGRLGLPPRGDTKQPMNVVVEHKGELYSLMVDEVGDVLSMPVDSIEKVPANMDENWKNMASGVCKLEGGLLVILDSSSLLTL